MAEHVAPLTGDQLQPTACSLLTEDRDIRQSIANLNDFIRTYNHISSSHCVDFFTRNLFTSLLREEWREQLAHMTYGQLTTLPMVTDDTLFSTKGECPLYSLDTAETATSSSMFSQNDLKCM